MRSMVSEVRIGADKHRKVLQMVTGGHRRSQKVAQWDGKDMEWTGKVSSPIPLPCELHELWIRGSK
jgi:hypothetical protein